MYHAWSVDNNVRCAGGCAGRGLCRQHAAIGVAAAVSATHPARHHSHGTIYRWCLNTPEAPI